MNFLDGSNDSDGVGAHLKRDTIHIIRDTFQSEQFGDIIGCLAGEGHRCVTHEGLDQICTALGDQRSKLLCLGVSGHELPSLVERIRAGAGKALEVAVLVYLKQPLSGNERELLAPEISDFFLEPLNLRDMCLRVNRLMKQSPGSLDEVGHAKLELLSHYGLSQFIGGAPAFLALVGKIPRVAACDATVLLTGETGTGKELCARAIHYLSSHADKPFIPVNCGSIPAELFENEIFGHEAGAFTDARHSKRGLIAEAEDGTLFLDEVDSLAASAQVKLLRFLQDQQYKPLGASRYQQARIRLIAASNQDLQRLVRERNFREDLLYRLRIISLHLPALRDRQEDILPLALHFLSVSAQEYNRHVTRFSSGAVQKLLSYTWPGNVRELENVVRQAVVLSDGAMIHSHDLHLPLDAASLTPPVKESFKIAKKRTIEAFERAYLTEIISVCNGNISMAAREAKKHPRAFYALLKKYGITPTARATVK